MTMMSKESIELDHEEEGQIGLAGLDHAKINAEYLKLIEYFDSSYESSDLRNDATVIHPDCLPITG